MVDPFSGNLQEFSESKEPKLWRSERTHRPTKRLVELSLFGCPALAHNHFHRFNFWIKALCIMSFVALQMRHNKFMHELDNGTANYPDSCVLSATLVDNDTYFYGQAMTQPNRLSFIKAMVKEVDGLFGNCVWQL
jgi:hypothetical protein